jgi:homoserine acetyltransferase
MFGNGVSSSPTNRRGPHGGGAFPNITIYDNVRLQRRLATELLDIERFAITARTLLMPCATDLYFRTADNEAELQHLKNGRLIEIPSIWGHMAGAGQHEPDTAFIDQHLQTLLAD